MVFLTKKKKKIKIEKFVKERVTVKSIVRVGSIAKILKIKLEFSFLFMIR